LGMPLTPNPEVTRVQWVRYKGYAGCKIDGRTPVSLPSTSLHMDRAFFLTAQLEAPRYGSVQSYDGAGLSGGPLHNIAVYPSSGTQGSLFALLSRMELARTPGFAMIALLDQYRARGWAITSKGVLSEVQTGKPVTGADILQELAPLRGVVPQTGPYWEQARRWALLHHQVFSESALFDAQKEYAINWLIQGQQNTEELFYQRRPVRTMLVEKDISMAEDLALCVYHAFSVNAPAIAQKILLSAIKSKDFPKVLLGTFRASTFANWQVRYDRTRAVALTSGLWPVALFTGPKAIFSP